LRITSIRKVWTKIKNPNRADGSEAGWRRHRKAGAYLPKPMNMTKQKKTIITIVNNEDLSFVIPDPSGEVRVLDSLSLDQFLNAGMESGPVPEEVSNRVNRLLIVPDYWFGNVTYKFQSRKKSIIEAFIERKLLAEHPDLPDIKCFFGYILHQIDQGEKGLYVYFLQEPKSFQLYDQLIKFDLNPHCITTPAFVWGQKLREIIPDFHNGGKGLVHMLSKECLLYFFFRGFFLFSRSIIFPDTQMESSEKLNTLTYEINQSFHLFSQKAKAGIDQVYIASSVQSDARELSDMLGREVKELEGPEENQPKAPVIGGHLGAAERFSLTDLSPSRKFLSVLHQLQRKELEWKPVQAVGIAVGLLLLLLFGAESFFLWKLSQPSLFPTARAGITTETDPRHTIQQYNEALDSLVLESERPSPQDTILKVVKSLPDNFLIKEMSVEVEGMPSVHIKGVVKASGPDKLRDSISYLLANLKTHFHGARSLSLQNIDVELAKINNTQQENQNYLVKFGFNLP